MMKKLKKIIHMIAIIGIVLTIPIQVFAATINIIDPKFDTGSTDTEEETDPYVHHSWDATDGITYMCSYDYYVYPIQQITIDTYDKENNKLTETYLTIDKKDAILSGTSIGVNLYETKEVLFEVQDDGERYARFYVEKIENTEETSCIKWKNTCDCCPVERVCNNTILQDITLGFRMQLLAINGCISIPNCDKASKQSKICYEEPQNGTCQPRCVNGRNKNCRYECIETTSTSKSTKNRITDTTNEYYKKCEELVLNKIKSETEYYGTYATYEIYLNDSNDYNAVNNPAAENANIITGVKDCKNNNCQEAEYEIEEDDKEYGLFKIKHKKNQKTRHNYYPNAVCMDVKTSKVRYLLGNETYCKKDEVEILNDKNKSDTYEHWHYFVPLNTKSNDDFILSILHYKNGEKYNENQCKQVIDNHPKDYQNIMIDGDTKPLKGGEDKKSIEAAKLQIQHSGGCYLQTVIHIPTKQEFYNENITTNSENKEIVKFNGFNFYYKPIDINNENQVDIIFPNGVTTNTNGELTFKSLWSDWYKSQIKSSSSSKTDILDLKKSYSIVTYYTNGINANEVRTYNEDNPYTSWSSMNIDGTSNYISSEGSFITKVAKNTTNIYKLGCGPANEEEYIDDEKKIKNIYYQKECAS